MNTDALAQKLRAFLYSMLILHLDPDATKYCMLLKNGPGYESIFSGYLTLTLLMMPM